MTEHTTGTGIARLEDVESFRLRARAWLADAGYYVCKGLPPS